MSEEVTQRHRYASLHWESDLIGVPAMFMALGIFLLYPGTYLLGFFFDRVVGRNILDALIVVLSIFALYVAYRFISQLLLDSRVLWDFSADYFRIGTWVAGVNVLAVLIFRLSPIVAQGTHLLGWVLWIIYMWWVVKMVLRRQLSGGYLNGTIFLTTVATQSTVISFMIIFGESISQFLGWLVILNVLGIIFYWISFALVWIVGGFAEPFVNWVPQNNISHGALSITMLAAQMIEEHMPGSLPYFHLVIQVAWIITSLLFVSSLFYELYLILSRKKELLRFQIGNYARNFTYGMFFACSFYGFNYSRQSVMKDMLDPSILLPLGFLVLFVNLWELAHQTSHALLHRTRMNPLWRLDSEIK